MKKPNLFICNKIIKHIETAETKLSEISIKINEIEDDLIMQGLFVLSVSFFENMLSDSLAYLLQKFPQKIPKGKYNISKEFAVEVVYSKDLINNIVEQEISSLTYKSLKEILSEYVGYFSLELNFDENEVGALNEIKESRNLLLHNNLLINSTYILKSGDFAREKKENKKLKLDVQYIKDALTKIGTFMKLIKISINEKYKDYTYIKATEKLWYFMFHSDVMKFEDYWDLDIDEDKIISSKNSHWESNLSTSEVSLLSLWRTLFTGRAGIESFDYYHLDTSNRQKVNLLFELASEYWFWSGEYN